MTFLVLMKSEARLEIKYSYINKKLERNRIGLAKVELRWERHLPASNCETKKEIKQSLFSKVITKTYGHLVRSFKDFTVFQR